MTSLRQATIRNLGAVGLAQAGLRLFSVVRNIVLARFLLPADFGIFSIASSIVTGARRLENFGLEAALVQRKTCPPEILASGFLFRLFSSATCFLAILIFSPWVAGFFKNDLLSVVMRVLAVVILVGLPGFIGRVSLTRALEFKKLSVIELLGAAAGMITTIVSAVAGLGVWSLVLGTLAGEAVHASLYFWRAIEKPSLKRAQWDAAKELLRFGRPLMGAAVVSFLVTNLDNLIVGKLLGASTLGFYAVAYSWANFPVSAFINVVGKVIFPTVATIQDNVERVRRGYLDAVKLSAMVVAPLCLGLLALAPQFIRIVLGERWLPAAPAMRILCLYALIRAIGGIGGSFRKGLGRPDIFFKLGLLFLVVMLIGIFPLTWKWGITGTALSVLIAALVSNIAVYFYNKQLMQLAPGAVFKAASMPLAFAAAASLFMFALIQICSFFVVVIVGTLAYAFLLFLFCRKEFVDLWEMALKPSAKREEEEENGSLP